MRNIDAYALAVALLSGVGLAAAQTGARVVETGPGFAGAAQTVNVDATITGIDVATREVTLKGPQGREVVVTAGPEVRNFDQMQVGDQVKVEYVEALTLELKKGPSAAPSRTEQTSAARAAVGERPAGSVGRTTKITADVVAIDPDKRLVTLKGPRQTLELKVRDPEQLKLVNVGDQVEAVYTEAVAVSVTIPKK